MWLCQDIHEPSARVDETFSFLQLPDAFIQNNSPFIQAIYIYYYVYVCSFTIDRARFERRCEGMASPLVEENDKKHPIFLKLSSHYNYYNIHFVMQIFSK